MENLLVLIGPFCDLRHMISDLLPCYTRTLAPTHFPSLLHQPVLLFRLIPTITPMTQPHRELIEYHPTLSACGPWLEAGVRIAIRIPTLLKLGPRRYWRTGTRLGGEPADRVAFRPSHKILINDVRLRLESVLSRSARWLPRHSK